MIDTHTHLYDEQFEQDRIEMIQRAIDSGVERMYLPNCDATTIEPMFEVERKFPNHCFAMMGLHPCYVKENVDEELNIVRKWLDERKFCAVGEIGLDYYWDKSFVELQKQAFRMQIEWALEFNIPIVENKPLARTIFKTLKVGQAIPRELYTAVAEVLSYIFRLKGKRFS